MNNFLTIFKEYVHNFWDYSEAQKQQVLTNILQYATDYSEQFIEEVNPILFDEELGALPIVVEALSHDAAKWGDFFVDLTDQILLRAKNTKQPLNVMKHFIEFAYIEKSTAPFVETIVNKLLDELDGNHWEMEIGVICVLSNFLSNTTLWSRPTIIARLQQKLHAPYWKIRVVTFKVLTFEHSLPANYQLRWQDRLALLLFGEPAII